MHFNHNRAVVAATLHSILGQAPTAEQLRSTMGYGTYVSEENANRPIEEQTLVRGN